MTTTTRLYGLTIQSELPLHQQREVAGASSIDLEIAWGVPVARCDDRPGGRTVLHLDVDRQYYTATERPDSSYLLRFYGTCDVAVSRDLRVARIHLFPNADRDLAAVLAGGTVIAFVLAMRGAAVLHASAVQIGDVSVAFVGASGMGKSTTATLMCAEGARLITDDLLVLNLDHGTPTCSLGATEVRLRKSAGELSDRFATLPGRRTTGDDRDALAVLSATTEDLPLAAIIIPVPDHTQGRTQAELERLDPMRAFLMLSRFPRLVGWEDDAVLRRQFQQLGDLIDRVPVHLARLPWGPPFAPDLAASIRRELGLP